MQTRLTIWLMASAACGAAQAPPATMTGTQAAPPKTTASAPAKTPKFKTKAAPNARPVKPLTIPAAAIKTEDGSYHFKDAQGRSWTYWQSPFGVTRRADDDQNSAIKVQRGQTPFGTAKANPSATPKPALTPAASSDPNEHTTAVAKGSMVRFERPSPFGSTVWEKNKSELTADEQKIWDREQAKGTH